MSDIGGSGNSAFDGAFFALQAIGLAVWLLSLPLLFWPRAAFGWAALGLGTTLGFVVPFGWMVTMPPANGLEGAGRILFCAPWSLGNSVAGAIWAGLLAARLHRSVWRAIGPFGVVACAGVGSFFLP